MIRRNRRPDWRRIKTLRSYTTDEAASTLQVHRNAVRYWIKKCALPVMTDRRPHLIQGAELVAFLKRRREARRRKCGPGQFFCLKCRQPQSPAAGMVDYQAISTSRGALVGICPVCETLMRRFVSRVRLNVVARESGLQIAHRQEGLKNTATPVLNCHFRDED